MKEYHLKFYTQTEKSFTVKLGNGTEHVFTSKRNTLNFLANTSRFLTHHLVNFNFIFIELLALHREFWIQNPSAKLDRLIKSKFEIIDYRIEKSLFFSQTNKGCIYSYIDLIKAFEVIQELIKIFQSEFENINKAETIKRHKLNRLFTQVQSHLNELNNYEKVSCKNLFSIEKYNELSDKIYLKQA